MRRFSFYILIATAGCAVNAQAPRPSWAEAENLTDGWITMTPEGQILVYYDRSPNVAYGCRAEHGGCRDYIELAGGIEPGQRKRIAAPGQTYEALPNGNLRIFGWTAPLPSGQTQPAPYDLSPSDPTYRCYEDELPYLRDVGRHTMTLSNQHRIRACLGG